MLLRLAPETLRDLAYHHENEVEEVSEEVPSTIALFTAPLWKSESSTPTLIHTTTPWQLRTGRLKGTEHVYEGRFPKIFMENLNSESSKTKVKMTSAIRMGKFASPACPLHLITSWFGR